MFKFASVSFCVLLLSLSACQVQTVKRNDALFMPFVGGNESVIASTPLKELRHLQLISTNLVSALVQIPELKVGSATLQVSNPKTAFGNTLIRALEDAGFGIQRVSADQGLNYVTYGKRFAETEAGPVTDFGIAVGDIEVRREYDVTGGRIFPSSLLLVSGTDSIVEIELDDTIFAEQGGTGDSFISGVGGNRLNSPTTAVSTVTVNDYDVTPLNKRTDQAEILSLTRQKIYTKESLERPKNLSDYTQMRRMVLIFENKSSTVMGRGNKRAVGELADEFRDGDVISIAACNDADGKNEASQFRAVRVEEEFVSHGVSPAAVQIEPCVRASYRHSSDDSPVAVSIVQYRLI